MILDHYTRMINTYDVLGSDASTHTLSIINKCIETMIYKSTSTRQSEVRLQGYQQSLQAISELMELEALDENIQ